MPYNPHIKRLLDVILAWTAFIFLSPLLLFISFLVCIDSKGSPFFKQERIGRYLIPFRLIKFRSMSLKKDADKGRFDPGDSSRVTKIGSWLRNTKIDELPQLFNVMTGDMSIVGPRPEVRRYVEEYIDEFREILIIRPGLSDLASIKYRKEESILAAQDDPETYYRKEILPDKLQLSRAYARNICLKDDVLVIVRSIKRIGNLTH